MYWFYQKVEKKSNKNERIFETLIQKTIKSQEKIENFLNTWEFINLT